MFQDFRRAVLARLPASWRHQAVEFKNSLWGGWRHHFYSHFGEDAFIDAYFRHKKGGFYVDVGAHHPFRYSNTALLYERGWRGINVEPDAHLLQSFLRHRTRDINLQCGAGDKEQVLEFHRFSDPAVNTFSSENSLRLKNKKWLEEIAVEKVQVRRLESILSDHLPTNTNIDFLNVDVEDLDFAVLNSNDWDRYRPTLIAIEDRFFDILNPRESKIFSFLTEKNYVFTAQLGLTLIFHAREEVARKK